MAFVDDSKGYVTAAGGARVEDYFALLKPRVMSLVVFTAIIGLLLAPGGLTGGINPVVAVIAILCIAIGAGGSGALNMWYDADIDRVMAVGYRAWIDEQLALPATSHRSSPTSWPV